MTAVRGGLVHISSAIIADRVAMIEIDNDVFEVRFYIRPIGHLVPTSDRLQPIQQHKPEKGQFQQKL
ncbi:hypothetical protein [Hoeflea sp.]|uniref:hypothetical protein n=1 Tax=Hoeflea sp. TaxID=1940281 RepID=UPI0019B96C37|nr:hypothetical protein [Hoeflea sp.]MBC7281010.1 hypothetical protein [Hoeflea sp.]